MKVSEQVAALEQRVDALIAANATLRGRIDELEELMNLSAPKMNALHLTAMQRKILPLLLAKEIVTREMLYAGMYNGTRSEPQDKTLDVHICKLRKKLPPSVSIKSDHGVGWYIPQEHKAFLRNGSA